MNNHIRFFRPFYILCGLSFSFIPTLWAQDIHSVLQQINKNNLQIQAAEKNVHASLCELKATNTLGNTSVSYSPFYANGVHGIASSELVVSQEIDFPTLYVTRKKANRQMSQVFKKQQQLVQRDIMLQAYTLCLEWVYSEKLEKTLARRLQFTTDRLKALEKKLQVQEATLLDVNRIKMEAMFQSTELEKCRTSQNRILLGLQALNGNQPIQPKIDTYPIFPKIENEDTFLNTFLTADLQIQQAQHTVQAAEKQVTVAQQELLPSLSLGYRRNTSLTDKSHGVLIGASMPLFSNKSKTRAAKARHEYVVSNQEALSTQVETEVRALLMEIKGIEHMLATYDLGVIEESLSAIDKAYSLQHISIQDYCVESRNVLQELLTYYDLEYKWHWLRAQLEKNNLFLGC